MKLFFIGILSSIIVTTSTSFGQLRYFGDIQGGVSAQKQEGMLFGVSGGFNAVLKSNLLLRAGVDFSLGGKFTLPNTTISYLNYNVRVGYVNVISEKFAIVPYIGAGFLSGISTNNTFNSDSEIVAAVGSTLVDAEIERRYESKDFSSFVVPVGVDFHVHGDKAGFVIGYYMNFSEYAEAMGVRLGITFGQLGKLVKSEGE
jgi:hypothetical protein